jgi:hypothetical protein
MPPSSEVLPALGSLPGSGSVLGLLPGSVLELLLPGSVFEWKSVSGQPWVHLQPEPSV